MVGAMAVAAQSDNGLSWSTWISLAALALSVWTLARANLAKRDAALLLRWTVPATKTPGLHDNLVLHNAGPALARDLRIRFVNADGTDTEPQRGNLLYSSEGLTVLGLPPHHDYRIQYERSLFELPEAAEISWKDGRTKRQRLVVPLTMETVGSTVVVEVDVHVPPTPTPGNRRPPGR